MTSLKPQELFDAFERGETIEVLHADSPVWREWTANTWFRGSVYRIVKSKEKETVVLYRYLCKSGGNYWVSDHQSYEPPGTCIVRRLDETRMEIEVDE